jgi:Fe2+ or Zn2+ uptake regulation protein
VLGVRTPGELTEEFRQRGLKITPQRQLIFRLLHENPAHPSADSVFAAALAEMPAISLRTVYQTLNDLAAMGELHALDLGTGSARFDPNVDEHHHVVCERCGEVRDVYVEQLPTPTIGVDGFRVHKTQIVFRGVCAPCHGGSGQAVDDHRDHPTPPQGEAHHG